MSKIIMIFMLLLAPISSQGGNFGFSLGAGLQYSGVLGTQFSFRQKNIKYHLSVGVPGYSLGLEKSFSRYNNHSVGLVAEKCLCSLQEKMLNIHLLLITTIFQGLAILVGLLEEG